MALGSNPFKSSDEDLESLQRGVLIAIQLFVFGLVLLMLAYVTYVPPP